MQEEHLTGLSESGNVVAFVAALVGLFIQETELSCQTTLQSVGFSSVE